MIWVKNMSMKIALISSDWVWWLTCIIPGNGSRWIESIVRTWNHLKLERWCNLLRVGIQKLTWSEGWCFGVARKITVDLPNIIIRWSHNYYILITLIWISFSSSANRHDSPYLEFGFTKPYAKLQSQETATPLQSSETHVRFFKAWGVKFAQLFDCLFDSGPQNLGMFASFTRDKL